MKNKSVIAVITVGTVILAGCWNPFSPNTEEGEEDQYFDSPDSVYKVLANFELAWNQQNHDRYMETLDQTFEFHLLETDWADYDGDGVEDQSWGISIEEQFTQALFENAFNVELVLNGNEEYPWTGDTTGVFRECPRTFVLKVYTNPEQQGWIAQGTARFILAPDSTDGIWRIYHWFDESDI